MRLRTAIIGCVALAALAGAGCKNPTYDERVRQMDYLYRAGAYGSAARALFEATGGEVGGELVPQNVESAQNTGDTENVN